MILFQKLKKFNFDRFYYFLTFSELNILVCDKKKHDHKTHFKF